MMITPFWGCSESQAEVEQSFAIVFVHRRGGQSAGQADGAAVAALEVASIGSGVEQAEGCERVGITFSRNKPAPQFLAGSSRLMGERSMKAK